MAEYKVQSIQPKNWGRIRLKKVLKELDGKRVLVIGDVGVDRYTTGAVDRICPEAPVPIVRVESELLKLGLAANVADNIRSLGGMPVLVGVIGADRSGEDFKGLLESADIKNAHLIVDSERRTVLKERVVSERQQLLRIDYETRGFIRSKVESEILKKVKKSVTQADIVILQDYAKGTVTPGLARGVISLARKAGKRVAVDPHPKSKVESYRGAFLLTPNTAEAERLSGIEIRDEESLARAGQTIVKATLAHYVVITRGKDGMAVFKKGTRIMKLMPTYAREVYDVSGAGDTVIAVLALALAAGAEMEEASVLGNLAAGVEVSKRGTATVSPDEIQVALEFFSAMVG